MTDEEIMFIRLFAPIKAKIQDKNRDITELEKENTKLSKMLNEAIDFIEQEDMQCKLCSFYSSCRDKYCPYNDETPISDIIRAELEKRVEEHKNDNNCPDVMCDDCNKGCELKKIMGETK